MSKLKVCNEATCIAAAGLISIRTEDGSRIVVTPDLARQLVQNLPVLAAQAEGIASSQARRLLPPDFPLRKYTQRPPIQ